jgi:uncharacterized protein YceH (UPF0502 family)
MSADPTSPAALPVLSVAERRVLGVLAEKQKTTPDVYPMSVNALVTGSNQKSSREPVLNLSEEDVEEALVSAQQKGLVLKITGGRVVRWRHNLYDAWHVDKVELAVLAELLLRGLQTEGELRGRASRMEPIDDLDALRAVLRRLKERGLAVYLSPEGRRGTVVTHGFHSSQELERLQATHGAGAPELTSAEMGGPRPAPAAPSATPAEASKVAALETGLEEAQAEIASLRAVVADLQGQVAALAEQIRALREALGA